MDGKDWIYTKRVKTEQSVKIPLLRSAKDILHKYLELPLANDTKIFPVISNQKINKYLKDIVQSIDVRKNYNTSTKLDHCLS